MEQTKAKMMKKWWPKGWKNEELIIFNFPASPHKILISLGV